MIACDQCAKPRAVLTKDQVVHIYSLYASSTADRKPTATSLGRAFGVSEKTIRDIWSARTWCEETSYLDLNRQPKMRKKIGRPLGCKDRAPRRPKVGAKKADSKASLARSDKNDELEAPLENSAYTVKQTNFCFEMNKRQEVSATSNAAAFAFQSNVGFPETGNFISDLRSQMSAVSYYSEPTGAEEKSLCSSTASSYMSGPSTTHQLQSRATGGFEGSYTAGWQTAVGKVGQCAPQTEGPNLQRIISASLPHASSLDPSSLATRWHQWQALYGPPGALPLPHLTPMEPIWNLATAPLHRQPQLRFASHPQAGVLGHSSLFRTLP